MNSVILRKVSSFRQLAQSRGLGWTIRSAVDRSMVWLLCKRYGLVPDHHQRTNQRPYREYVADAVNSLRPKTVVEVGCGIGSILARVKAPIRIGYDIDPKAIRAAKALRSGQISFKVGVPADVTEAQFDVLVLVNWIQMVSPEYLEAGLLPLLRRTRYIIADTIDPGSPGYPYYHDLAFLDGKATQIRTFKVPGEGRTFRVFETLR